MSILRHSFSKIDFAPLDFSLNFIHEVSYNDFLYSKSLKKSCIYSSLKSIFPIFDSSGLICIDFVDYRLIQPNYTPDECKLKGLTYKIDLMVKLTLTVFSFDEKTETRRIRSIKEQEVFFCSIPALTDSGVFVVNGLERIVVSQIHKSPGVVFNKKIKNNVLFPVASIIPYRGSRIEFVYENLNLISCKIDKKKKISLYLFMRGFGISDAKILNFFYSGLDLVYLDNDIWELNLNKETLLGSYLSISLRDRDGNVIFSKDSIVSKLVAKKISSLDKIYCKTEDLVGSFLFKKVQVNDNIYDLPYIIEDSFLEDFKASGQKSLCIINSNILHFSPVIYHMMDKEKGKTEEDFVLELAKNLYPSDYFTYKEAIRAIKNLLFSPIYYNLFNVGRYKINKELNINVSEDMMCLTEEDIFYTVKKLLASKYDNFIYDIDSLAHKRVRPVGELVENQFRVGLGKVSKYAFEKLNSVVIDTVTPSDFIISSSINNVIKQFFMLSPLSQFLDFINVLSRVAHQKRISFLGKGGLGERPGAEVRDINHSFYSKICAIETPDGSNIGLVVSLAACARLSEMGTIEAPYLKVENGAVNTDKVYYLDASEEQNYKIANISNVGKDRKLNASFVPVRYKADFIMTSSEEVNFVDASSRQLTSVLSSFIPNANHNDIGRLLMACNMLRQALPLLFPDVMAVATGVEADVAKHCGVLEKVNFDCEVLSVDSENVIVGNKETLEFKILKLRKFSRTNQNTLYNQNPVVKVGQKLKSGDLVCDASGIKNGEISLGVNCLVAFMPFDGFNYEDSIAISKRLAGRFKYLKVEERVVSIKDTRLGLEKITRDLNKNEDKLKYLDETGIINVGSHVKKGDILVGKLVPKVETPSTPEERLLRAIFEFESSNEKDASLISDVSGVVVNVECLTARGIEKNSTALKIERKRILQRMKQKDLEIGLLEGIIAERFNRITDLNSKLKIKDRFQAKYNQQLSVEIANLKTDYENSLEKIESVYLKDIEKIMDGDELSDGSLVTVKIYIACEYVLQPGDKLAGRHGDKGVISKVFPVEDMPFMEDGTPVDMVLNPLGVPGRMNIAQILETHLGLASYGIAKKIEHMLEEKQAVSKIRKFLNEVSVSKKFTDEVNSYSDEKLIALANDYRNFFPVSSPIFDGASIDEISTLLNHSGYSETGQVYLYDGKTGERFERPVTVGLKYTFVLDHIAKDKLAKRSTGKYSYITRQPLRGRERQGGQRVGEMEVWAFEGHGAAFNLLEIMTLKSDDIDGRVDAYRKIVKGNICLANFGIPESFKVLAKEIEAIGLSLEIRKDF